MKRIKKVLALAIAMAMVLGMMSISAFATEGGSGHTISVSDGDNHTYKIYQVLTGTLSEQGSKNLGDPQWGADVISNPGDVNTFIKSLEGKEKADVADLVAAKVDTTKSGQGTVDKDHPATGLATGYYILIDITNLTAEGFVNDTKALHVVQVLNDVKGFTVKYESVTPEKKIASDTLGVDANVNMVDDVIDNVSVGDTVSFQLTGTVPARAATDYDYFFYIMNDTLSEGLTFDASSVKVYAVNNGTDTELTADTDYKLYTGTDSSDKATYADGKTFQVAMINAKNYAGQTIKVTYNATLNENAVIGEEGNPNKFDITFSNNPNYNYDGDKDSTTPGKPDKTKDSPVGETPEQETKTYSTGIKIQKVDQNGNILTGAGFTITGDSTQIVLVSSETFTEDANGEYYKLKDGKYTKDAPVTAAYMEEAAAGAIAGYVVDTTYSGDDAVTVAGTTYRPYNAATDSGLTVYILHEANSDSYDSTTTKYTKTTSTVEQKDTKTTEATAMVNDQGVVTFSGLGAGTYTITESTTPAGYNTMTPLNVTITFDKDSTPKWTATDGTASYTLEEGVFKIRIENNQGTSLPSTGGIGTTIFYIVGACLVIGAGVVLITKRRMEG